jgi:hypothetical protein
MNNKKPKFSGDINFQELIFDEPLFFICIDLEKSNETQTTISYLKIHDNRRYYHVVQGVWCMKANFHFQNRALERTQTFIYIVEMWSYEDLINHTNGII